MCVRRGCALIYIQFDRRGNPAIPSDNAKEVRLGQMDCGKL